MISFIDFKHDMEMATLSFTDKQLLDIYSSIATDCHWTVEDVEMDYAEQPEFIVTADKNLSALLENLSSYQNEEDLLVDFMGNQYGQVIDLFYLPQDEMFAMACGYR